MTTINPWPEYPMTKRTGYGQEEALAVYKNSIIKHQTSTTRFIGAECGSIVAIEVVKVNQSFQPIDGTQETLKPI